MIPSSIPLQLGDREPIQPSTLATCIVGGDTAGLLFGLFAGIWRQELGRDVGAWPIVLLTNPLSEPPSTRVSIDKRPFEAMRDEIDDSLFDELLTFLEMQEYRPRINELDAMLVDLIARLGIRPQLIPTELGNESLSTAELRRVLEHAGLATPEMALSVVISDPTSPLSAELEAPQNRLPGATLVRLRVEASASESALPEKLHARRHHSLARLNGSVLDYRRVTDHLAEVDLFLPPGEHHAATALTGKQAVVSAGQLMEAPLLSAVVDQLANRLSVKPTSVVVDDVCEQSVCWVERVACVMPTSLVAGRKVATDAAFLIGEPAMSLPFFRNPAALVLCVESLASILAGLAATGSAADDLALAVSAYNEEVVSIQDVELDTVERRAAGLDASAATAATISLLPLPSPPSMLTQPRNVELSEPMTARSAGTAIGVLAATALAVFTPFIGVAGLLSVPLQAVAGAHHRLHLDETRRPNRVVSATCWFQLVGLLVFGATTAFGYPTALGLLAQVVGAAAWVALPVVFGMGMVAIARQTSATQNESDLAMTRPEGSNIADAAPRLRPSQPPSQRPSQATMTYDSPA